MADLQVTWGLRLPCPQKARLPTGSQQGSPSQEASGDVRLDIQTHRKAQVSAGESCLTASLS